MYIPFHHCSIAIIIVAISYSNTHMNLYIIIIVVNPMLFSVCYLQDPRYFELTGSYVKQRCMCRTSLSLYQVSFLSMARSHLANTIEAMAVYATKAHTSATGTRQIRKNERRVLEPIECIATWLKISVLPFVSLVTDLYVHSEDNVYR
jgi:type IV secretory pathway VirB3-like protein